MERIRKLTEVFSSFIQNIEDNLFARAKKPHKLESIAGSRVSTMENLYKR